MIGKPISTIISEEDASLLKHRLKELFINIDIINIDLNYKTQSGDKIPIHFLASRIKDVNENLEGIVTIAHDMRKISRLIQKVEEEKEWLSTTLSSIGDAVIATDVEGCVLFMNYIAENLTAWSQTDAIGKPAEDIFHIINEETGKKVESPVRTVLKYGNIVGLANHTILLAKDGRRIFIDDSAAPIKNSNGNKIGVVLVFRDISARRKYEKKLKIQQEQLIRSDKMASLGTLVTGVAHEINNPNCFIMINAPVLEHMWNDLMPVIKEYSDLHKKFSIGGLPIEDAKEAIPNLLKGINEGSIRIKNIVEKLKNYAGENTNTQWEYFDINQIIESATTLMDGLIKQSTKHFTLDLLPDLPKSKGNVQEIEQVIVNLITNACQSLEDQDKKIVITTDYVNESKQIVITITDEGIGIAPEKLKKIYDPFYTTKRDIGGTGLGLSISWDIINNHQGTIEFKSKFSQGTTVIVKLPVGQLI